MSRFESGCRRFTEMYPNWRRDLPRKQTGRNTDVGVQIPPSPLCSRSPSGRGIRFKPGQGRVRIPPGVQALVPERNMDPAKDRRFAGSNPAKGIFGMWRNGRRAVLRPQSARLRVRLPPYRFHGGLPQRKTGPVQTRFSEGSNPLSFIYNQQERGN